MQANVFQSDFRMLNEDELVYKISNRRNVLFDSESSFGDIVNQLTPGRMEIALAAVELYTRKKARNNLREKIHSSTDVYRIMQPIMVNQEVEELWAIYMNMASRIVKMKRISVGGIAQTLVDIRVLLKEAFLILIKSGLRITFFYTSFLRELPVLSLRLYFLLFISTSWSCSRFCCEGICWSHYNKVELCFMRNLHTYRLYFL